MIIKKYPMYSCSIEELERYMDYLERFEDFVPDILINDYPDIMLPPNANDATRDNLNKMYMTHKRWADDRNMLVAIVSQATRAAIGSKRLSKKDFAEDIRKIANCDTAVGICQTEGQSVAGLSTLYIVGARRGTEGVGCGIVMNLDIGQFASSSFPVNIGVQIAQEEEDRESAIAEKRKRNSDG